MQIACAAFDPVGGDSDAIDADFFCGVMLESDENIVEIHSFSSRHDLLLIYWNWYAYAGEKFFFSKIVISNDPNTQSGVYEAQFWDSDCRLDALNTSKTEVLKFDLQPPQVELISYFWNPS